MGGASSASLQPAPSSQSRGVPAPRAEYPRQSFQAAGDNINNSAQNYSANQSGLQAYVAYPVYGRTSAVPDVTVQGNGYGQWRYPPQNYQRRRSSVQQPVYASPLPETARSTNSDQSAAAPSGGDTSLDNEISRCIAADQSQDTSMDMTLSRVMTADEFLLRMEETDRGIASMASYPDRQSTYAAVKESVGLRGHLQDELLRIEAMLAADDPALDRLNVFESSFPRVVAKLRELHEKGKVMRAITDDANGGPASQPFAVSTLDPSIMRTIQIHIQPDDELADEDDDNITQPEQLEDKLKNKHVQEEEQVTENFAKRITGTETDVDQVLQEHLVSMQALRTKQDLEKARIQKKIQKRLLDRREQMVKVEAPPTIQPITNHHYVTNVAFGASRNQLPPLGGVHNQPTSSGSQKKDGYSDDDSDDYDMDLQEIIARSCLKKNQDDDEFADNIEEDAAAAAMRQQLDDQFKNNKKMTSDDFKSMMDAFRAQQEADNKRAEMAEQATNTDDNRKAGVSISCGDDTDNEDAGTSAELEHEDKDFVARIKSNKNITDEEFNELMKKHLAASEALKRSRRGEKNKFDDMLADRLNKHADDEDLKKLETDFKAELSRNRAELSELDLAAMLAQYRKDQQSIINKRNSEKSRHDDLLHAKLEQRENQRKKNKILAQLSRPQDIAAIFELAAKNGSCDEKFFHELQRMRGTDELTEDVFQELLKNYLNSAQKEKPKKIPKKDSGLEDVRQEASTLMHEHEVNRKQINNIRQRERKAFDDRLQERLASKT